MSGEIYSYTDVPVDLIRLAGSLIQWLVDGGFAIRGMAEFHKETEMRHPWFRVEAGYEGEYVLEIQCEGVSAKPAVYVYGLVSTTSD